MVRGRRCFARSYVHLRDGRTLYIKEDVNNFFEQPSESFTVHLAYLFGKERVSISKKDVFRYGRVFPERAFFCK